VEAVSLLQWVFDALLGFALLWLAWRALASPDLFRAIVLFIAFGLLMALAWVRLDATDIALAEAAIGAGLTGALLLAALARLDKSSWREFGRTSMSPPGENNKDVIHRSKDEAGAPNKMTMNSQSMTEGGKKQTPFLLLLMVFVHLGFSKEVGAFLAGVSLASTPYREAIGARLVSLRNFLLLFFFIDLGAGLELVILGAQVVPAVILSLFVLVGNPLITISASTYMILYSHPLYERISPWLDVFERKRTHREDAQDLTTGASGVDVILFGLGRFGSGIARELRQRGHRVLGVGFDPDLVHRQEGNDYAVRYGDAEDPGFVATLPLEQVRWVLSSVR